MKKIIIGCLILMSVGLLSMGNYHKKTITIIETLQQPFHSGVRGGMNGKFFLVRITVNENAEIDFDSVVINNKLKLNIEIKEPLNHWNSNIYKNGDVLLLSSTAPNEMLVKCDNEKIKGVLFLHINHQAKRINIGAFNVTEGFDYE